MSVNPDLKLLYMNPAAVLWCVCPLEHLYKYTLLWTEKCEQTV